MKPVVVGLAVLVSLTQRIAPVAAQPAARILVMPFENTTRDPQMFWMGEAAAVLLADDLIGLGHDAITREERRVAFERLQVPPAASLTDATVIRVGQIVGASDVIVGTLGYEGGKLVVQARRITLESAKVQSRAAERGPTVELFAIFERVARALSPSASSVVPSAKALLPPHPPVAAFEDYVKGLLATSSETAVGHLNGALRRHPSFDRARLALWDVYTNEGEYDRALAAALAVPEGSAVARRARFLAGLSQIELKKYDAAFATFKALVDARATAPALNNLGVIQLRRAPTPQTGLPVYWFDRAAKADAEEPDFFFNLGYAYWMARDAPAAIYWLREALRRNPADADAHFVLSAALAGAGNAAESTRERELARRLSSSYDAREKSGGDAVPRGLERVKGDVELPHNRRLDEILSAAGARDQQDLAQFYFDRAQRAFGEKRDREALADLDRMLFLAPYHAEAHLLAGRIHLRAGRTHDAIDTLKISLWSQETLEAHLVLGEAYLDAREAAAARVEAERALALAPASMAARQLFDRAGADPAVPAR